MKIVMRPPGFLCALTARLLGSCKQARVSTAEWRSVARTWEDLARSDPLWAVLSEPDKRARQWNVETFFETGEELVERVLSRAEAAGARMKHEFAVDFGCGVGRLSRALARRFDKVIGIDVSETMLTIARELNKDRAGLTFVLNQHDHLRSMPDACADFVCSHITLQHLRPALAERYIREFFRITRPGGYVYFQLPSHLIPSDAETHMSSDHCRAELDICSVPKVLGPGLVGHLTVRIRNAGPAAWRAPLYLGNHWRDLDGEVTRYDDGRSPLPPLMSGETAEITLAVAAPEQPGAYQLEVDIVQEGVRWFADVGNPTSSVSIDVIAGAKDERGMPSPRAVVDNIDPVYVPAPAFEMHGISRGRVEQIASESSMRLIRCDDYLSDWLSHEYVFEKLGATHSSPR